VPRSAVRILDHIVAYQFVGRHDEADKLEAYMKRLTKNVAG
jgi:hypothetical protein